jgi:uncharacterized membrane protein YozB (DUF420 family)
MATMEGGREPRPGASAPVPSASDPKHRRHPVRREVLASLFRSGLVIVALTCIYSLAPLGRRFDGAVALQLAAWLLVFLAVVAWQLLAVIRSPHPGLRAGEAVAVSVPLFVLVFATTYFVTGQVSPGSFSEPLTRIDAVYFSVTIFATVGFGDISARSEEARMLVTAQMLADLLLIGFIAKILFGVVQQRRQALALDPPLRTLD